MITDTVAIGDWTSSYEPFDVIFNFNFPANRAQEQQIHRFCINHKNKEKIIYTIGLYDTTIFNDSLINIFLRLLPHLSSHNGKHILFHCYAGISRSSTAAIIYFMLSTNLSFESICNMIIKKRPRICPNPAFIKILHICEKKRNIITKT
jgi:protein-tyrosine phosphatase